MSDFFRKLWPLVRPYRKRLFLGLICGMFVALANGALYLVVKLVVDFIFTGQAHLSFDQQMARAPHFLRPWLQSLAARLPSLQTSSEGVLMVVVCSIPVIMFCRSLFTYLNVYLVNWASTRAIADLRTKAFAHLQAMPLSFFSQSNTGDLISRVTSDTQTLRTIIGSSLASLVSDPITVLVLAAVLLSRQPALTLISLIVLPACIAPITIYARKVRRSARAMQTHAAELSKLMHESFTGNRIVKAYNLEEKVLSEFHQTTRKFVSQTMRVVRANEIPGDVLEFLGGIGVTLILFYIVHQHARSPGGGFFSGRTMTPGDFFAFLFAIFSMYKPIKSLTRLHNQLHQAQAASARVFELLDMQSTMPEPSAPRPLNAAGADICFEHIEFSYGEKLVLRDINLRVRSGQLVALVGSSGSGKTTLVNLLPRFYDPQRGAVSIGGTDIRQVASPDLRRQMAIVTQETILFHDTIRNNIAVGRPGASDAEIEAAARHAHAHQFIMEKPGGYDAIAGEKGVALSGGQRQRIAIARAILKNAPILILDEATSSLDTESERAVQAALEQLMRDRTTICIAHRLSTIQHADLIVVMSEGRIVETGTHVRLLEQGGVYQRLHALQFQS